jgi:hypothetical protein
VVGAANPINKEDTMKLILAALLALAPPAAVNADETTDLIAPSVLYMEATRCLRTRALQTI